MTTPKVKDVKNIACPEGKEDYKPSLVFYEDGKTGFDCDGDCPHCEYDAERQIWKERGYPGKFGM